MGAGLKTVILRRQPKNLIANMQALAENNETPRFARGDRLRDWNVCSPLSFRGPDESGRNLVAGVRTLAEGNETPRCAWSDRLGDWNLCSPLSFRGSDESGRNLVAGVRTLVESNETPRFVRSDSKTRPLDPHPKCLKVMSQPHLKGGRAFASSWLRKSRL